MKLLDISQEILLNVIDNGTPFILSTKNVLKHKILNPEEKGLASSLSGCALRHYLIFDYRINALNVEFSLKEKSCIMLVLANNLFIKRFSKEEVTSFINDNFDSVDKYDAVMELLNQISDPNLLIPESIDKASNEYLSLRFNTPVWIVKILQKHYGYKFAFKTLKANSKPSLNSCRVNTSIISKSELLEKYPQFFDDCEYQNMVIYKSKAALFNSKPFADKEVFGMPFSLKYLMDCLDIDIFRGTAIYTAYSSNQTYLDIMARYSNNLCADIICGQAQAYFDTKKQIERYGLTKLMIYECKPSSIVTCISSPVHLFIVMPLSSNFAMLRNTPDYFLRIKQENLDSLIADQKVALEEASDHIEENGQLVYAVPTMNLKEGHYIVKEFLEKHNDFELVNEKQFFPFDPYDSTLYFAVLKKVAE